jgi:hypothetical protein
MRIVQFAGPEGQINVGLVVASSDSLQLVKSGIAVYDLAMEAAEVGRSLEDVVNRNITSDLVNYKKIISENRLLAPLTHPDPAHCIVSGTGLNHLGSALARDAMHTKEGSSSVVMTDSMKMFKLGMEGGKPKEGNVGAQPEWFYKGNGSSIVAPGHPLKLPAFALDGGEEAELVGLYIINKSGRVFRMGFALGNEFSDHVLEKQNYLYLAHSKLRDCSIGPELLVGSLPDKIQGLVRLVRNGEEVWSNHFQTGEGNMTHSIANMEYHHFKYERFRRPGDIHCHFLGASVLSFSEKITAKPGDSFEISAPEFGKPLINPIELDPAEDSQNVKIQKL